MKETTKQNLLRIACKHASNSVCNRLQQLVQYMSLRARAKQERRRYILRQLSGAIPVIAVRRGDWYSREAGMGHTE